MNAEMLMMLKYSQEVESSSDIVFVLTSAQT